MFVFGGDCHHMAFNDLYLLDLAGEFEDRLSLIDESMN
jgi:hypothetical protein